ncbi:MAG: DUF4007 family protein [Herpetosiphonaceae bacterium]|nr:DUF4007 family protein [Herpetosiphonaceae bacterium]
MTIFRPLKTSVAPTFSGHETFALRGNWLKKAYDSLDQYPNLFARPDAFILLGVGKNMAQSIRYWGRVCGVFDKKPSSHAYISTELGHRLLADDGWDPFLITPAGRWLLHWQITSRLEGAYTWFYTFNLLRRGEFTVANLGKSIQEHAQAHSWGVPSDTTISRDIECMINCYIRPSRQQIDRAVEDALSCPLAELGLMQQLPGQNTFHLIVGSKPDLPDALLAYAIRDLMISAGRETLALSDLAYGERSPGKVFRLDEDSLLDRLQRLEEITEGRAVYADQAGIRQVQWSNVSDQAEDFSLLDRAFNEAVHD